MQALKLLAAMGLALATAFPSVAQDRRGPPHRETPVGVSVITLGTAGGPPPHIGLAQPSTLLLVDGKKYLIDAGEAAGHQLLQARIPPRALDAILITHLHWDHTLGLDYLMATEWMRGRTKALPIYGPPGLNLLMTRQFAALSVGEDIFRAQAQERPQLTSLYPANEIATCALAEVFRDAFVRVTAVCNSHFSEVRAAAHSYGEDRSLSYRFDTKYGSVTFTGDTGPSADLEKLANGSDMLVSEIVDVPSIGRALQMTSPDADISRLMAHMSHQHLTPEALGRLATRAKVKKLVLTHFVVGADFKPEQFISQLRPYFAGEIVVGHDLEKIPL